MRAVAGRLAILAAVAAAVPLGCGGPGPGGAPRAAAPAETGAMPHQDAAFLVDYGGTPILVDVRYVDVIRESVIAVRLPQGRSETAGRAAMSVAPEAPLPQAEVAFSDDGWRAVAVDIADEIQGRPLVCVEGQTMRIAQNDDAEARTLYRANRRAWVVFAFCPPPASQPTG